MLITRNRNFFLVWFGQLISQCGDKIYSIALMWYILEKTGSAADMGLVMMVSAIPPVIFAAFAGVCVDRWNRKWIMVITDLLRGILVCLLSAYIYYGYFNIYTIYAMIFLLSCLATFFNPAISSAIPMIVEEKDIQQAMSFNQITRDISVIAGSAAGGIIIAMVSIPAAFFINGVSFIFSAICELPIKIPSIHTDEQSMLDQMKQGFSYIKKQSVIFNMLISFGFINFFGIPILLLMPVIVKEILHKDAQYLGYLETAMAVGSFIGAILLAKMQLPERKHNFIFAAFLFNAAVFLIFAYATSFPIFAAFIFCIGLLLALINISLTTSFQQNVADEFKGRFFSILELIATAAFPLSFGIFGWTAESLGLQTTFLICAAGLLAGAVYFRTIKGIDAV